MNYKLFPSDLTYLYDGCKFCFWLKVKHGISQPSMPMPGVFSAIAARQKEFYAGKRTEEFCRDLPPGVVVYGEERVQSKPISFEGLGDECYILGRFDLVIKFDDGSYGIIDAKTASSSEAKAAMYGRQLQAYAYALENSENGALHLTPIEKLGLFFFEPKSFMQLDASEQAFKGNLKWVEVTRDDAQFGEFIREVLGTLAEAKPPPSSSECSWCHYRDTMKGFNLEESKAAPATQTSAGPACRQKSMATIQTLIYCPQCNGEMRLRSGKFGEFWSCQKYPACKGTRNKS
jgi:hypothetical protein